MYIYLYIYLYIYVYIYIFIYPLLDEDAFQTRCNMAMVELEPMADEEEINAREYGHAADLGTARPGRRARRPDALRRGAPAPADHAPRALRRLAPRGAIILEHWDAYLAKFRKVMPVEYTPGARRARQGQSRRHAGDE